MIYAIVQTEDRSDLLAKTIESMHHRKVKICLIIHGRDEDTIALALAYWANKVVSHVILGFMGTYYQAATLGAGMLTEEFSVAPRDWLYLCWAKYEHSEGWVERLEEYKPPEDVLITSLELEPEMPHNRPIGLIKGSMVALAREGVPGSNWLIATRDMYDTAMMLQTGRTDADKRLCDGMAGTKRFAALNLVTNLAQDHPGGQPLDVKYRL